MNVCRVGPVTGREGETPGSAVGFLDGVAPAAPVVVTSPPPVLAD